MSKLSQVKKVVEFLKQNPNTRFTARDIAENITRIYAEDYAEKSNNPRFTNDNEFITQIVAEIGSSKKRIEKLNGNIHFQDKPRPRVYWYQNNDKNIIHDQKNTQTEISKEKEFSEHDLYPILIDYLTSELNLYCKRIDEKRSTNSRGSGGNKWLHPDIVAIEPVDKDWQDIVKTCVKEGNGQNVRLWSFEVKKELNSSNVRESFFQAVSNSSWANEGYLVATSIVGSLVEAELRMLSALHGIGVIILNPQNPSESEMILPANARMEVDWQSVNRIVKENTDFKDYIELVSMYYQTSRIIESNWNK